MFNHQTTQINQKDPPPFYEISPSSDFTEPSYEHLQLAKQLVISQDWLGRIWAALNNDVFPKLGAGNRLRDCKDPVFVYAYLYTNRDNLRMDLFNVETVTVLKTLFAEMDRLEA